MQQVNMQRLFLKMIHAYPRALWTEAISVQTSHWSIALVYPLAVGLLQWWILLTCRCPCEKGYSHPSWDPNRRKTSHLPEEGWWALQRRCLGSEMSFKTLKAFGFLPWHCHVSLGFITCFPYAHRWGPLGLCWGPRCLVVWRNHGR